MSQVGSQLDSDEDDVKRWTAKRRVALVLEILRGDATSQEAARKHGLTVAEIDEWRERFLSGAENALRSKPLNEEALREQEVKRLKQKIGELVIDMDIFKKGCDSLLSHRRDRTCQTLRGGRRARALARQASDERDGVCH